MMNVNMKPQTPEEEKEEQNVMDTSANHFDSELKAERDQVQ